MEKFLKIVLSVFCLVAVQAEAGYFLFSSGRSRAPQRPHVEASLSPSPEKICVFYTEKAERTHQIPSQLLAAIALTESGRPTAKGITPWPWTVNVEGKGYYYPNKQAAIQAVRAFQKKGFVSIDVGCMQINLMHHPQAFKNLEQAFDPYHNVHYGAKFLKALKNSGHPWVKAMAHYHSATPKLQTLYQDRVLRNWKKARDLTGGLWAFADIPHDETKGLAESGTPPDPQPRSHRPAPSARPGKIQTIVRTQHRLLKDRTRAVFFSPPPRRPTINRMPRVLPAVQRATHDMVHNRRHSP